MKRICRYSQESAYLRREMLMFKKHVRKSAAVLALCGLLLLTLLTGLGSASAQTIRAVPRPRPLVRVVNSGIVAPYRTVVVRATCPFGSRVENGRVRVFHAARVNIFFLSRNAFTIRANRPLAGRRGWVSRVHNNSRFTLRVQVTATCRR